MVANSLQAGSSGRGLHAQCSGPAGAPDVLLLHGLFGMGSNLGGLARALAERYRVHQLDLPNHGRSPWQTAMSLGDLAAAVDAYASDAARAPFALVGHSLGGKVAMQLALDQPRRLSALVAADIAPVEYPPSHQRVFAAIEAVDAAAPRSRREAGEIMAPMLEEEAVRQFLLLSLARGAQGDYRWRFNVEALRSGYGALRAAPAGAGPCPVPLFLVYGGASQYVDARGRSAAAALFPDLETLEIPGVGHWLHAEAPASFNAAVLNFLQRRVPVGRVM
jgi:esterase